jgi:nucleotide-binding universal stress UspA family protein
MKRILVGVDGSGPAIAALGWATRLATRTGAEIVIANVVHPDDREFFVDTTDERAIDSEQHLLSDWSAPLQTSDVTWSTLVLAGHPDALLGAADREDVDLIVVGTQDHGGVAALHLGSLAHHLAHRSRRPLAIIPEPAAHETIDHLLVGVDESDGSSAATNWTADLASRSGSDVLAVYVFEPLAEWIPETDPRSWYQAAQHRLDTTWVEPLRAAGVPVETSIVESFHVVAALTTAAEDAGAGLIVVGTTRVDDTFGMRLGHVPLQLVHHAQIPLVLVPPTVP